MLADRIAAGEPRRAARDRTSRRPAGVIELAPLAVDIARASVAGVPSARAPGRDRTARRRRRRHRLHSGVQGRDQRAVQVVRRRARQRPADRQAGRCSPRRRAAAGTRSSSTSRCARCSPTCARSRCRPRCSPPRRTGAPPSSASVSSAPRPSSPSCSRARSSSGIADRAWSGYQHEFAGNATRAEQTAADIDFDSPLMRLAAGGRAD